MSQYLGIDLGGSKIEHGVLTFKGFKFLGRTETPKTINEITEKLVDLISNFSGNKVGIGVAGLVDKNRGKILFSPNLPFKNYDLKTKLSNRTGKEIVLENDVNCFTLAQYQKMKKKPSSLIGITLGTGIGGGIVLNGKIYRGKGLAGEVGHMRILVDGPVCHCGGKGCLEALASGWALEREGKRIITREIKAEEMAEKARQGEKEFVKIFQKMGYYLGVGLANLTNLFSPEEIVIGGSLIKSKDLFWKEMLASFKSQSFPKLPSSVKISSARNTVGAVAYGAALLAKEDF